MIQIFSILKISTKAAVQLYSNRCFFVIVLRWAQDMKIWAYHMDLCWVCSFLTFIPWIYKTRIEHIPFNLIECTDDFCLYTGNKPAFTLINQWLSNNGFTICEDETQMTIFTRYQTQHSFVTWSNTRFYFVNSMNYLGMILD